MRNAYACCVALGVLFTVISSSPARADAPKKVPVLIVVDTSEPLAVDYRTSGKRVRKTVMAALMPGLLPALIEAKVDSNQWKADSKRLQDTVEPFDRRPAVEAALAAAFRASSPSFDPIVAKNPSAYGAWKHLDLKKARADGYPFVLAVRESFAGMVTAWEMETLSASSMLEYELYDSSKGERLADGKLRAFSPTKHSLQEGTANKVQFITEYVVPLGIVCAQVYGDLNKKDTLHTMAERYGIGNEVPAVNAVLKKYERLFDYSFALPAHWHIVKGASKYSATIEPDNDDKMKMGVSFSVDLLVPELGQDVKTIDEYAGFAIDRMKKAGYATDSAEPFDALTLKQRHVALLMDRPNGAGKEALVMRQAGDKFVAVYNIVFLSDYDGFIKKYGHDLESVIDGASITTRNR